MKYAQINQTSTEAIQINENEIIAWDSTHFCRILKLTADQIVQFKIVELHVTPEPQIDPITQTVMRDGCEFANNVWQYKWSIIELFATQEERDKAHAELAEDMRLASIPFKVDMRQARLALLQSGHLSTVSNAIASMQGVDGDAARIEWEFAATVIRDDSLTQALISILGLTDLQVDELFTQAGKL